MMEKLIKKSLVLLVLLAALAGGAIGPTPGNEVLGAKAVRGRTVVDQNGRMVKLPAKIRRAVVTTIWPLPSVFLMVDGSARKLVGIPPASKSAARVSLFATMAPEILKAKTAFVNGTDVNLEELMKLRPDVVLYRAENTPEQVKLEKSGIPAVAFKTASLADGDAIENVYAWMKLLGQVLGKETKVADFRKYASQALNLLHSKLQSVPVGKKPRAMILFRHNEKQIVVSGTGHFGHYWLNTTGAVNVAANLKNMAVVNMEQIYQWDPEIIYITNFSETMPEDLMGNKVKGQDWSRIRAIKEKKVYKIPLGIYRWYPPCTDSPLMLKWMARKNHPEKFQEMSIEKEIKTYYQKFYKYQLNEKQIKRILNPPREAARDAS
ncbi:MAG: ABC transporter substrate-binding protein [Bacillota bacterium]|jgi:iron complex transport system substrate-binding protein